MHRLTKAVAAIALVAAALAAPVAIAQSNYPAKPIRLVTGYAPGGTTTVIARLVGHKLTENLGQQVLVDNRPGAGTMLGTDIVAKSAPDGYTLLLAGGSIVLVPLVYKAPYDPIRDLAPVATIAGTELVLLGHPSLPANDLRELIAHAKAHPNKINYATPGAGGNQHLGHELLNILAGIKTQHIPYKGSSQALTDLLAGQVQLYFSTTVTAIPQIAAGKVKAFAITGSKRLPMLPNVPTFEEAGLPTFFRLGGYYGIVAPARTPEQIVNKLAAEIAKYQAEPGFQETLQKQGLTPHTAGPKEYAEILKTAQGNYASVLKKIDFKFEQ